MKIILLNLPCWNCTLFKTVSPKNLWKWSIEAWAMLQRHMLSSTSVFFPAYINEESVSLIQSFIKYRPLSNTWLSQVLLPVIFVQVHVDFTDWSSYSGFPAVQLRAKFDQILSRNLSRIGPLLLDIGSRTNVLQHNPIGWKAFSLSHQN